MKKRLAMFLVVAMFAATILTGCGGGDQPADDPTEGDEGKVYTLKWAHVSPASGDKQADEIIETMKKIEEQSDGRLIIEHYPAAQLGNEGEIFEGLQMGTIEIGTLSSGSLGGFYSGVLATTIPFLFQSREEAWEFFNSDTAKWLADEMYAETGVQNLGWAENGLRCFTSSNKQIKSPADLVGMKIRTQQNQVTMAMVEALGGSPQPIDFAELYTSLQQGAVDGQENPPSLVYTQGLYEVQPYMTLSYHVYDFLGVFANPDSLAALPDDLREILISNIDEFVQLERERSRSYDQRDIQNMKDAGVSVYELTDDEYQQFMDKTASVQDVVRGISGDDVVDRVIAEIEKMRSN